MSDHRLMRLGRKPARTDQRTLKLTTYLTTGLPSPPASVDWTLATKQPWGMMLNDSIGDCTCAAAGHLIQLWTANNGAERTPSDAAILAAYEAVGNYNPDDPSTDQGAVEIDVLKFWRTSGIAGDKIGAFVSVDMKCSTCVRAALDLFGGLYIGLSLPLSAQNQSTWSVPWYGARGKGKPGSWGGHAVCLVAYNKSGLTCITWGEPQRMTWGFLQRYADEAYALLSSEWVLPGKRAPSGFDLAALRSDLALVTQ